MCSIFGLVSKNCTADSELLNISISNGMEPKSNCWYLMSPKIVENSKLSIENEKVRSSVVLIGLPEPLIVTSK